MALDATPGGSAANSYIDVVGADAYFGVCVTAAEWQAISSEDKALALQQATMELDRLLFKGRRRTSTQSLSFPRHPQRELGNVIPTSVQRACCEQALHIWRNRNSRGRSSAQLKSGQGVRSFSIGDHSEAFFQGGSGGGIEQQALSSEAQGLLLRWIAKSGRICP